MRRLFFVAIAALFLVAALIPSSAAAVTDGERLAMFSKPSVVRIIDGVAGGFYYAPPNRKSGKTYNVSYVGLGSGFFINSDGYIVTNAHVVSTFHEINQKGRDVGAIPKFEEVKRLFPEHSEVNLLIQGSQQAIAEGKDQSGFPSWTIIAIVLVVLFLIVALLVIGVVAFLIVRKRNKGKAKAGPETKPAGSGPTSSPSGPGPGSSWTPPTPAASAPAASATPSAGPSASPAASPQVPPGVDRSATIDLSQTVAILPQSDTAPINYGTITFISGVLAGQKFDVTPEGACIGRDSSSSQIVIADPRISKRHVWVGVRGGRVVIEDQSSRNGTFLNDPKSERITENALSEGDTVILGESDVARFEYRK